MERFEESGMFFEFVKEDIFRIEKSDIYQNKMNNTFKIAEFVALKQIKNKCCIIMVEAKSSYPNKNNSQSKEKFDIFTKEIVEKFTNTFNLFLSCLLDYQNETISNKIKLALLEDRAPIKIILILRGFKKDWLRGIQETLNRELKSICMIWNSRVTVINDSMALGYNLIVEK